MENKWISNNIFYILTEGVGDDEDIYPDVGETVDRTGFAVFGPNCNFKKYPIRIKNCGKFYVYYLKPVSGCLTAYCFGKYVNNRFRSNVKSKSHY